VRAAIEILSLLMVGWIAGAELGSWCCVQPVVARLCRVHKPESTHAARSYS
jgi:hypothetical protein